MKTGRTPPSVRLRPPSAVWWAASCNAIHAAALTAWLVTLPDPWTSRLPASVWFYIGVAIFLAPVLAAAGAIAITPRVFARCSRTAWMVQLLLLCLLVGLVPLYGLLWIPLLIAWCGRATRDWFDPPTRRSFG